MISLLLVALLLGVPRPRAVVTLLLDLLRLNRLGLFLLNPSPKLSELFLLLLSLSEEGLQLGEVAAMITLFFPDVIELLYPGQLGWRR